MQIYFEETKVINKVCISYLFAIYWKGKGAEKKTVFFMVFLRIKKLPLLFLSEIRSQMCETNFTFGPIPKFYFFVL